MSNSGIYPYCPDAGSGLFATPLFLYAALNTTRTATVTAVPKFTELRYKYPNEQWQSIKPQNCGILDYTTEEVLDYCPSIEYRLVYEQIFANSTGIIGRSVATRNFPAGLSQQGPFGGLTLRFLFGGVPITTTDTDGLLWHWGFNRLGVPPNQNNRTRSYVAGIIDNTGTNRGILTYTGNGIKLLGIEPQDPNNIPPECTSSCTFTVTEDDVIVHQETRDVCPEVILADCFDDFEDTQTVSTNLDPGDILFIIRGKSSQLNSYTNLLLSQMAFIFGTFFSSDYLIPLFAQGQNNPEECILILRLDNFQDLFIVDQICSDCGCLPPEYEVACGSQQCPDGTCAVECGDHICCYNKEGIAVEIIPK